MSGELNPRFTFDTLVVGASNRLAIAAARSVAENPGRAHNPLFVYSDTGLGKTHLLMAIGQAALEFAPELMVAYLTLDDFVEAYHSAVSTGEVDAFRRRYASVDMLLIDDVQFLSRQKEMQEELVRLSAEMQQAGSQIVLTSDRPPSDMQDLDDRLLANLGGGLVIDIGPPDLETRLAILNRRIEQRGVEVAREVLEVIAEGTVQNVRELLGTLNRLIAFQAVSEHPLTPEAAQALVLGEEAEGRPFPSRSSATLEPHPEPSVPIDEFGMFLSGVAATLSEQVKRMGGRVQEAIGRWSAKGYRTDVLERAIASGDADVDTAIARYEESVAALRALQHQMSECDPERAGDAVFRDPERLQEASALVRRAQDEFEPPPGPSAAFDLAQFVESESTRMAVRAAAAIVEDPGNHYNPFVVVGAAGQGKTHLVHGIGRALQERIGGWVACVSGQTFMDQLVDAIAETRVPTWRARYRRASALLVDDVHLLGASERAQEELFLLFNTFATENRQLVFTSAIPPREIGLDDRLVSRLEGGLTVTLLSPDRELRRQIVVRQFTNRGGGIDDAVADFVAGQNADSVRSVLGLGHRVLTAAEARGVEPTLNVAREILSPERDSGASSRGHGTAGVLVLPTGGIDNREKVIWDWPDPADRIIEEVR